METYVGQIILVAFNRVPNGWVACNGQILPVNQYQALFSLLLNQFGGDGRTTFGVPDLRGRVPLHWGPATSGTSAYPFAQKGGLESVTLQSAQMPLHTHPVMVDANPGLTAVPQGGNFAQVENPASNTPFSSFTSGTPATPVALAPSAIGTQGGSQPHENRQPFLALNFLIATEGLYPNFS